jgi:hypothetical protein
MTISRSILLRMRNISDKFVEKIKTHFMFEDFFFRKSCHLWDYVQKYGRDRQTTDDNIMRRMRIACWKTKATHTQNIKYLLLFHSNNGYANAIQCYVYKHTACLFTYIFSLTCFDPLWTIIKDLQVNTKRTVSRYNTAPINKPVVHVKV